MAIYRPNLDTTKEQFHAKSVSFKGFKEMSLEDVERIKKLMESKTLGGKKQFISAGLDTYTNTLRYLINPTIHRELKTFDEKIMFLILACDPELQTFELFLQSEIIPQSEIEKASDPFEVAELKNLRKEQINAYVSIVRQKIGFYDSNLLKYEKILSEGLFKKESFVSDVKAPSINAIVDRAAAVKNIDSINNTNLSRLKRIVEKWLIEAKDPSDLNSLAYNLLNNFKSFHIFTVEEQVVLFMLIADPNLDLLRIYEEESKMDDIKERALSELGFYSQGFINLEKLYHKKFLPTEKISSWTK